MQVEALHVGSQFCNHGVLLLQWESFCTLEHYFDRTYQFHNKLSGTEMKTSQLQKAMVVNLPMDLKFTKKENSLSILSARLRIKRKHFAKNYWNFININSDSEIYCLLYFPITCRLDNSKTCQHFSLSSVKCLMTPPSFWLLPSVQ